MKLQQPQHSKKIYQILRIFFFINYITPESIFHPIPWWFSRFSAHEQIFFFFLITNLGNLSKFGPKFSPKLVSPAIHSDWIKVCICVCMRVFFSFTIFENVQCYLIWLQFRKKFGCCRVFIVTDFYEVLVGSCDMKKSVSSGGFQI